MEDLTQHIDDYLNGRLKESEVVEFEKRMEKDADFREEVAMQKELTTLLQEKERIALKNYVNEIARTEKKSTKFVALKIAAVILLLLLPTYFYISSLYSNKSLYDTYQATYEDRITTMGESDEVAKAMSAYNKGNYSEAITLFGEIRAQEPQDRLIIYEAVSYRKLNRHKEAIQLLKKNVNSSESPETLQWELVLNYLATNQGDKAEKELVSFLKNNKGYKEEKARELLNDLQSFWR